jgi:hypothetical protein
MYSSALSSSSIRALELKELNATEDKFEINRKQII